MAGTEYDYNNIPARALNVSSRNLLCKLLNPHMEIATRSHICKDYRGLAELMQFDYVTIRSFEATGNPTKKIIEEWELLPNSTIGNLLEMLKQIERFDVIDDIQQLIEQDVKSYILRKKKSHEAPIQVAEVSSGVKINSEPDDKDILTMDDIYIRQNTNNESEVAFFDAYVCYAEEDAHFVYKLAEYVERPEIGIKLCIKERNLVPGIDVNETLVRIIEERCSRMLIIMSPEFLNSAECKFQTRYATGLAVSQLERKLIPLIYKPCPIPTLLKYVSKIDFTKTDVHDWIWKKLLISIKGTIDNNIALPSPTFCESLYFASQASNQNLTYQSPPMLTAPTRRRSRSNSPQPNNAITSSAISTSSLTISTSTNNLSKSVSPVHRRKWFPKFSEIFSSSSSHSNSTNSSGFHSQSSPSHIIISNDIVEQMV